VSGWESAIAMEGPAEVARALAVLPAPALREVSERPARRRRALVALGLAGGGLLRPALDALEPTRHQLLSPSRWDLDDTLETLGLAANGDVPAAVLVRVGGYARRVAQILPSESPTDQFVRGALDVWDAGTLDRDARRAWRALARTLLDASELDLAAVVVAQLRADAHLRDQPAEAADQAERLAEANVAAGRDDAGLAAWLEASADWLGARRPKEAAAALKQARRCVGTDRRSLAKVKLQHAEIALKSGDIAGAVKAWRALEKVGADAPGVAARAAYSLAKLARVTNQRTAERRSLKSALRGALAAADVDLVERAATALVRRLRSDGIDDAVAVARAEIGADPMYAATVDALGE
jgi:hypothetical protein